MLNKSSMNHTTFLWKDYQALGRNNSYQFAPFQFAEKQGGQLMRINGKEWKKDRNIKNTVNSFA